MFPVRSLNDSYDEQKQQTAPSPGWGWFGRGGKTGSIATSDNSSDERSVLDEIRLHLVDSQESETPKDQGQREMCEKYLHTLLRTSPMVQFMVRNLTLVGCSPLDEDGQVSRIMFGKCPQTMAGGFAPSQKGQDVKQSGLLICYNGIADKKHMEATLAHEMMHWYDHCRFKVDWSNWRHIACSEIRAASLSGDCRFWREVINRGQVGMLKQHQKCVRRRATDSLFMSEYGPKDRQKAEQVVDEVWASCFNDTRPFDEIY